MTTPEEAREARVWAPNPANGDAIGTLRQHAKA